MSTSLPPATSTDSGGRKLGHSTAAGWVLTVYPTAGEAGGSFRSVRKDPDRDGSGGSGGDPDRSASEAERRARAKVRRYCSANRLNRLGTLTYGGDGCHNARRLRSNLAGFFRTLRGFLGEGFPYLWVPEWHKSHGLHAHFTVGRYVRKGLIDGAWPHGFTHIKLLGDLPVGSTSLGEARAAARYVSKYLGKGFGPGSGLHRYEVAQGFQPESLQVWGRTSNEALAAASKVMGDGPFHIWRSVEAEGWQGPPAVWAQWDV